MNETPENQDDINDDEQPKHRPRGCAWMFFLGMIFVGAVWGACLGVFVYILDEAEATIEKLEEFRPKIGSKIYSADGQELGEFSVEVRQLVSLNNIPLKVQKAFIATEDDTFYEHKGVRPLAILLSLIHI